MNSRERTFLALDFREPDRVPTDFWATAGTQRRLERAFGLSYEQFLDAHDIDLRYIEGPAYIGPPLRRYPDGSEEDIWGVRRRIVTLEMGEAEETYREVVGSPLALAQTVREVEEYPHWPSPDWFDYGGIEAQCAEIQRKGRVAVFQGDRLNRIAQLKPAMYLRGTEEIFLDMALRPDMARAIFARIQSFYLDYAERILEASRGKLDILLTGDDFGAQNGLLISPTMWEEFLGEGFAEYIVLAKSYGLRVMHHTCGSVRALIPLMLARGLDILQSLQPEAAGMDGGALKAEFGKRLAFHGGLSIQKTLPFGTPADVRNEVRDRVAALASGGGYILCTSHSIQIDTPLENIQALLAAYRDYGQYLAGK